jgi:hypothetical protein
LLVEQVVAVLVRVVTDMVQVAEEQGAIKQEKIQ